LLLAVHDEVDEAAPFEEFAAQKSISSPILIVFQKVRGPESRIGAPELENEPRPRSQPRRIHPARALHGRRPPAR